MTDDEARNIGALAAAAITRRDYAEAERLVGVMEDMARQTLENCKLIRDCIPALKLKDALEAERP